MHHVVVIVDLEAEWFTGYGLAFGIFQVLDLNARPPVVATQLSEIADTRI
jgi:hypothetical protein